MVPPAPGRRALAAHGLALALAAAGTARPALAPLARAIARSAASGAPLAPTVARVAEEQRSERRWKAEAAAARVGVRAVLPLAVCFLPAFVLVGVVPVVVGVAGSIFRA